MKPILLCLHGWGGSKESFTELRAALKDADLEILTPDLPGFGSEPEPAHPWSTDEYADWVVQWLHQQLRITDFGLRNQKILLLGHSHGGRIAIKLAARLNSDIRNPQSAFPIAHLYLCAAAGIRHPRHIKRIIGLTLAKTGKFFLSIPGLRLLAPLGKKFLYKLVRVHDYEKASPVMRQTLINVSAEDLTPLLHLVTVKTDIFWGSADGMTPLADGLLQSKLILQSELHVFPGVRHDVHRRCAAAIEDVIRKQL
ncbi:alpha/beta fold hydrolase [Candidatus Peribacteria bacterium]|nr:alpha/beta fold hydrolase [Candidatus Peribacteria bacterium]